MLVIADDFCRLILLFLPLCYFLIFDKLTVIDPVQIWILLVQKGTISVLRSMEKRNWNRSKRNWEIPISDQNRSAFIHLLILCFHHLILHLLKSRTKLHNQHNVSLKFLYKTSPFLFLSTSYHRCWIIWKFMILSSMFFIHVI